MLLNDKRLASRSFVESSSPSVARPFGPAPPSRRLVALPSEAATSAIEQSVSVSSDDARLPDPRSMLPLHYRQQVEVTIATRTATLVYKTHPLCSSRAAAFEVAIYVFTCWRIPKAGAFGVAPQAGRCSPTCLAIPLEEVQFQLARLHQLKGSLAISCQNHPLYPQLAYLQH